MKGRHLPANEEPQDDTDSTSHGLDCPSCDDGTLIKSLAANVVSELQTKGALGNVSRQAKYVYRCDACDYIEEVVRDGQEA